MKTLSTLPFLAIVAALLLTAGCGGGNTPELGYVEGTVTMDGKPLPGATVMFKPVKGGRPSGGITNEEGWYELTYSNTAKGARTGKHTVTIRTYMEPMPYADDPAKKNGSPETVPAKYNAKSTLEKTVESGDQTIDFPLDSQGKIVLPPNAVPIKGQSSDSASS